MMLSQPEIVSEFAPPAADERLARHTHELILARPRRVRLVAWLSARRLDRALLDGADPTGSAPLAARTLALRSTATRETLAAGLERRLELAHRPRSRRWWAPGSSAAVLENARALRALAALLRSPLALDAAGLAATLALLADADSPLYSDQHGSALALALADAQRRVLAGATIPVTRERITGEPAATDPARGRRPLTASFSSRA